MTREGDKLKRVEQSINNQGLQEKKRFLFLA
jgi:hypothetical protein